MMAFRQVCAQPLFIPLPLHLLPLMPPCPRRVPWKLAVQLNPMLFLGMAAAWLHPLLSPNPLGWMLMHALLHCGPPSVAALPRNVAIAAALPRNVAITAALPRNVAIAAALPRTVATAATLPRNVAIAIALPRNVAIAAAIPRNVTIWLTSPPEC